MLRPRNGARRRAEQARRYASGRGARRGGVRVREHTSPPAECRPMRSCIRCTATSVLARDAVPPQPGRTQAWLATVAMLLRPPRCTSGPPGTPASTADEPPCDPQPPGHLGCDTRRAPRIPDPCPALPPISRDHDLGLAGAAGGRGWATTDIPALAVGPPATHMPSANLHLANAEPPHAPSMLDVGRRDYCSTMMSSR